MKRRNSNIFSNIDAELALELFSSKSHLVVNKRLLKQYGPNCAIFISNLIDKYSYFKSKNELIEDDWFFLVLENQEEQTGMGITKLRTAKNQMIDAGILKVKRMGIPSKEYYKINFKHLLQDVSLNYSDAKTLGLALRKPESIIIINNNIKDISPQHKKINKLPNKKERAKEYLPLAKDLSDIIKNTKNINHSSKQLQEWAYEICKLVEDDNISIKRIQKAIIWYSKNIERQYVPVIESGKSLREKFIRLENAIERDNKPQINKPPIIDEYRGKYIWNQERGRYEHISSKEPYVA